MSTRSSAFTSPWPRPDGGHMVEERHAERGRRLAPEAAHGQAVRTVGGDLKLHRNVVEAQRLGDGRARGAPALGLGRVQHQDAVLDGVGEVVFGQAQLGQAAQHAAALHAAQLAFSDFLAAGQLRALVQRGGHKVAHLEVRRAGDDLQRGGLAHLHLADDHVVGVRVGHDGLDAADDDVLDRVGGALIALHLAAGHGDAGRPYSLAEQSKSANSFAQSMGISIVVVPLVLS